MTRTLWILVVLAAACSKHEDPPADAETCAKFVPSTAAIVEVGVERGMPQSKYIQPELLAAMRPDLTKLCATLPLGYATCVGNAKNDADADACGAAITSERLQLVKAELARIATAAVPTAVATVATAHECAKASVLMAKDASDKMPSGVKPPTAPDIAKLCLSDKWEADFVRCQAAGDAHCRALPSVTEGITRLVAAGQPKPPAPRAPAALIARFREWDLPGSASAWQGIWADKELGEVWEVTGEQVVRHGADGVKTMPFVVDSPCSVRIVDDPDPHHKHTVLRYALEPGTLIVGAHLPAMGERRGKVTVLCDGDLIVLLDSKGCQVWDAGGMSEADGWQKSTCRFHQGKDQDGVPQQQFEYTIYASSRYVAADVFNHDDMKSEFVRYPDLESALAAVKAE